MMSLELAFETKVILLHSCTVCGYATRELCWKYAEIPAWKNKYRFKKELDDKASFRRVELEGFDYIVCPKCGIVASVEACEREEPYEEN